MRWGLRLGNYSSRSLRSSSRPDQQQDMVGQRRRVPILARMAATGQKRSFEADNCCHIIAPILVGWYATGNRAIDTNSCAFGVR